jgi:hypothetical protein
MKGPIEVRKLSNGTIELANPQGLGTIVLTREQARTLADILLAATKNR